MHKVEQGQEVRLGGKTFTEGAELPPGRNYAGLMAAGKVVEIKEKIVVRSVPASEKPPVVESTEELADAPGDKDGSTTDGEAKPEPKKSGGRRVKRG